MEAYEDATSEIHGYLIVDCDPKSSRDTGRERLI